MRESQTLISLIRLTTLFMIMADICRKHHKHICYMISLITHLVTLIPIIILIRLNPLKFRETVENRMKEAIFLVMIQFLPYYLDKALLRTLRRMEMIPYA